MPTLDWIGKDAVVKHHQDVPYRLLEPVPELSLSSGDNGEFGGNLIVQGDNLHALKALLPRYAGKVKCIYIDPPYNTGNEGWVYNDNVNSPEIRKWLHEVVGREGEDLSRHDKWLCMMYPRLVLLKQFLRPDGAIFVSIDDNEMGSLRLLMDEVFGRAQFLATVVWQKKFAPQNDAKLIDADTEYLMLYSRNAARCRLNLLPRSEAMNSRYKNPDDDPRGVWASDNPLRREFREYAYYSITTPSGREVWPPPGTSWRFNKEEVPRLLEENRLWFGKDGKGVPRIKRFLSEVKQGVIPQTLWKHETVGNTQEAKKEAIEFNSKNIFDTPKPVRLIQRVVQIATNPGDIVLDSFAGSGTTAHAVLKQNAEDGGERKFILVEIDDKIARNVTAKRARDVVLGYTKAKEKHVPGLGGSFQFCRLSKLPLFDSDGAVRNDVTFAQLAEFVWFAESGTGFHGNADSPLIGVYEGRAIYLLYNGILKDRSVNGGNVLAGPVLDILPPHNGPKVIYAAACRLGAPRLRRENIEFKQTPYALEV